MNKHLEKIAEAYSAETRLRGVIHKTFGHPIGLDESYAQHGDDQDRVEYVMDIEEEFGKAIPGDELRKMHTPRHVLRYLNSQGIK